MRDVALGVRSARRIGDHGWADINGGLMSLEIDGWVITLYNRCNTLSYCDSAYCPDGREYRLDAARQQGTDPCELLSTWEHESLEKLLASL